MLINAIARHCFKCFTHISTLRLRRTQGARHVVILLFYSLCNLFHQKSKPFKLAAEDVSHPGVSDFPVFFSTVGLTQVYTLMTPGFQNLSCEGLFSFLLCSIFCKSSNIYSLIALKNRGKNVLQFDKRTNTVTQSPSVTQSSCTLGTARLPVLTVLIDCVLVFTDTQGYHGT